MAHPAEKYGDCRTSKCMTALHRVCYLVVASRGVPLEMRTLHQGGGGVQVKRKGRSVHVDPVDGINTEQLRKLVQALLLLQPGQFADKSGAAEAEPESGAAGAPAVGAAEADTTAAASPLQTVRLPRRLHIAMRRNACCGMAYLTPGRTGRGQTRSIPTRARTAALGPNACVHTACDSGDASGALILRHMHAAGRRTPVPCSPGRIV